jgi:hypothetical protein
MRPQNPIRSDYALEAKEGERNAILRKLAGDEHFPPSAAAAASP